MSNLGTQIAASLGYKKVLIIDDAYDETPALADIGDDPVAECAEALEDASTRSAFEKILKRKVESEKFIELLLEEEVVETLWKARTAESGAKKALSVLFSKAEGELRGKRKPIEPLEKLLRDGLQLDVVTLGSKDIGAQGKLADHYKDARLFFVDYFLDPQSREETAVDACIKKVATIYGQYGAGDKPIVVLMSSEKLTAEKQQRFRRGLNALGSHFSFVHKTSLTDSIGVQITLDGLQKNYRDACTIDRALDTWEKSAQKSVSQCARNLRALDIADYAFLDKFRLDDERIHLGHYVLWLYGEYLNSVIERQPEISNVADDLDDIRMDTVFPPSLMPNEELVQVYSGAVFSDFRPKPPRKNEQDDAHNYRVMLGDIYRKVYPEAVGKVEEAAVVITPSCNLARAAGGTKVTMLKGVLRPKVRVPAKDAMVPEFLCIEGEMYTATWDLEAPLVKTVKEITDECNAGQLERATRLRPLYALHLQRQYAADLLRVGMPVATQWYYPLSGEVYGKGDGNAAVRIMEFRDTEAFAWRITGKAEGEGAVVFLETFVNRLRDALNASTLKEKDKHLAEKLEELIKLREPVVVKGKEMQVGSFGVTLLDKYEVLTRHTAQSPILIRLFPGHTIPSGQSNAPDAAATPSV